MLFLDVSHVHSHIYYLIGYLVVALILGWIAAVHAHIGTSKDPQPWTGQYHSYIFFSMLFTYCLPCSEY